MATYVAGSNPQTTTARSQYLDAQRTQTVTGGLNRPALGEESYNRVVDVQGRDIPQPVSIPPEQSFPSVADKFRVPEEFQPYTKLPITQPLPTSSYSQLSQADIQRLNQEILQRQFIEGTAQGYSGTVLTPSQIAKAELLQNYNPIVNPAGVSVDALGQPISLATSPYGEYVISQKPQEFIPEKPTWQAIPEVSRPYEQLQTPSAYQTSQPSESGFNPIVQTAIPLLGLTQTGLREGAIYGQYAKDYQLLPGISISGLTGYASERVGSGIAGLTTLFASNKPYPIIVNEKGEATNIFGGTGEGVSFTPEQIDKLTSSGGDITKVLKKYEPGLPAGTYYKLSSQKQQLGEEIKITAPGTLLGLGYIYTGSGALGLGAKAAASTSLFLGGAEQYGTKRGKENLKSSSKVLGPIAYGLPAIEMGAGLLGLSQSAVSYQLKAAELNPKKITISQPYSQPFEVKVGRAGGIDTKEFTNTFVKQATVSKLPVLGTDIYKNPLTGEYIGRKVITGFSGELIPTDIGGFTFSGSGKAVAYNIFEPLTGKFKTFSSGVFPIGGIINPATKGLFRGNEYKAFEGRGFSGKTEVRIREKFGGISSESGDFTNVLSGTYKKITSTPFPRTAKIDVYRGIVLPEIEIGSSSFKGYRNIFPSGKGAYIGAAQELERPTSLILPNSGLKANLPIDLVFGTKIPQDLFGNMVFSLGVKQIPGYTSSALLFKFPSASLPKLFQTNVPVSTLAIKQIQTPTTMQVPKQIQIPEQVQTLSSSQVARQVQALTQIQVPKQLQIPTQSLVTRQVFRPAYPSFQVPRIPNVPPIKIVPELEQPKKRTYPIIKTSVPKRSSLIVEFRRRGKFQPIAKVSSPYAGVAIGKAAARKTLGASFRIKTPEGKFLPLTPSQEFRLGKTPGTLVQRDIARLQSGSERREIAQSRKIRGLTVYPKGKTVFGYPIIKKQKGIFKL